MEGGSPNPASAPAGAVFLSYASEDEPAVERIATALRNTGLEVWFDKTELRGGDVWDRQIRQQIHDCRLFIAVISAHTEARDEGYFRREWRLAIERAGDMADDKAFLVPVAIDGTSERSARVPDPFKHVQWTRLPGGETTSVFVERIQRLLVPQASSASATIAPVFPRPTTMQPAVRLDHRQWQLRPVLWAIGFVLAVGLAYFVAEHFWISKRSPTDGAASSTANTAATVATFNPPLHSIAVLPFVNMSGDKEQEYFSDGMTDALTTDLAQIGSLRVISRTSAMHFKDSKQTLPQIGRDLQVDAVVEGTVARGENRVRVTAQLVEASSDHHVWAKTYERDLKNVLALQDEIAQDITEQIRVKLTPKERSALVQVHAVDPKVHDAYLRGRYWAYKGTSEGVWKALKYYQTAIAKDPNYALAYAGVADAYLALTNWATQFSAGSRVLSPEEVSSKVKEAAVKAIELGPSLAEPHASLAATKLFSDWDFSVAAAELKQAIALNPNLATAHLWYSYYLEFTERLDEAVDESERARDLDPFDIYSNERLGQALYHARRYDDALRQLQQTVEMFPEWGQRLYWEIAEVYEQKRMFAEAFAARQHAQSLDNDPNVTVLGEAYKRAGYRGYLVKRIQTLEQGPHQAFTFPYLAHLYATLNDEPHAMSCLERAYEEHNLAVLFMRTAPELDPIRSSPRFQDLVRRIGFPQSPSDRD